MDKDRHKAKMDTRITILDASGVTEMSLEEAEEYFSTVEAAHIYDYNKVLNTLSPDIRLPSESICLSYVGKNRDTVPMIADLRGRIMKKQVKIAILVYKRAYLPETVGTKAWVIGQLMKRNHLTMSFYDDALDHLFSAYELSKGRSLRTFLVRSGGLSKEEIEKTSVEFSKAVTHLPSLVQFLRAGERGATMMNRSRIHRLLYSNAALLARAFEVTLSGPCGNQLKNSSGETINVVHSDDDRMSSIVLEKANRILFHRYYSDSTEYQQAAKALVDFIKTD